MVAELLKKRRNPLKWKEHSLEMIRDGNYPISSTNFSIESLVNSRTFLQVSILPSQSLCSIKLISERSSWLQNRIASERCKEIASSTILFFSLSTSYPSRYFFTLADRGLKSKRILRRCYEGLFHGYGVTEHFRANLKTICLKLRLREYRFLKWEQGIMF